jgi:hypothetical protein
MGNPALQANLGRLVAVAGGRDGDRHVQQPKDRGLVFGAHGFEAVAALLGDDGEPVHSGR